MDIKTFEKKLNELNLTKKEFANMVGAVYNGVVNWNTKGETPKWVDSWLENYEQQKSFNNLVNEVEKYTVKEIKMNDIKELLKQKYLMLNLRKTQDCLKLNYQYHQVKINIYFDYYENTFNLFLILSYEKSYYFTPINIDNLIVKNPYLNDVPKEILGQILDNGSLKDFYDNMREHMIHDDVQKSDYEDYEFRNGLKSNKNEDKNPFLSHLRKTPMSENHLNFLNTQFNISKYILQKIKAKGYTIVTTANFSERKSLTLILNNCDIKL
ncbi:hypothetical protein [Campylobacter canadensis]|uniref:Uncharacterized protein n=1 Tax=Campylobacter canadensis TaxID=449520 RepID=A0ABS7WU64_9BACT|nr:hypothetical protein [Campylobacter canadensis]MBZ7987459.1 hypothetical protein [Campylobacter canadensis]MBZ7995359.1 hypothetical protein [Campylobacter canadensis]MBZ7996743.1 hypothetical protein [Campylobacter canadensis]MBZ7998654.1 hypothetical protein [Campylobacter canadensis]MBZ8000737.1 hypothetical protein [Campylobacter canadensis]